jgi:hypothetical protein
MEEYSSEQCVTVIRIIVRTLCHGQCWISLCFSFTEQCWRNVAHSSQPGVRYIAHSHSRIVRAHAVLTEHNCTCVITLHSAVGIAKLSWQHWPLGFRCKWYGTNRYALSSCPVARLPLQLSLVGGTFNTAHWRRSAARDTTSHDCDASTEADASGQRKHAEGEQTAVASCQRVLDAAPVSSVDSATVQRAQQLVEWLSSLTRPAAEAASGDRELIAISLHHVSGPLLAACRRTAHCMLASAYAPHLEEP